MYTGNLNEPDSTVDPVTVKLFVKLPEPETSNSTIGKGWLMPILPLADPEYGFPVVVE